MFLISRMPWREWLVSAVIAFVGTALLVTGSVQRLTGLLSIAGLVATFLFAIPPALVAIAGQTLSSRAGLPLRQSGLRANLLAAGIAASPASSS